MFGARTLDVFNVPRNWYVKSIRYDGREIADTPTEFKADTTLSVEVVLSNRGAIVRGRVLDGRGEPVRSIRVLMFPARPQLRAEHRYLTASTDASGAFRLGPQRGGEYVLVALPRSVSEPSHWDAVRLARLAEQGDRIRIDDDEERTLDLYVVK
jgi:hypothetical protein